MAEVWPDWTSKQLDRRSALWTGQLRPNAVTYSLEVLYRVPGLLQNVSLHSAQPRVFVKAPALVRRPNDPEGEIPHVYWLEGDSSKGDPALCLFDAEAREWSTTDYIADTTIPWSCLWLNWYEGWVLTGKWLGSGRHAAEPSGGPSARKTREAITVGGYTS